MLAAITYLGEAGEVTSRLTFDGTVESIGEDVLAVRRHDTDEPFTLPPGPDLYEPVPPAEYRLRESGRVVVNPDLITRLVVGPITDED